MITRTRPQRTTTTADFDATRERHMSKTVNVLSRWRRSAAALAVAAAVVPLAIVAASPASAGAADITNPAEHPYPITVTIDGQTYHDGEDTLPGYDDYLCTPIPDVQYDFADDLILYYDNQGDLLATAPWTEWSRISSYQVWVSQQQAASNPGSGNTTTTTTKTTATTTTTKSATTPSTTTASPATKAPVSTSSKVAKVKVRKVVGAVIKDPTSKTPGRYEVTVDAPSEKSTATGKVTIKLKKGKIVETLSGKLLHGAVVVAVPKLSRGTWNVAVSWPGDTHYLSASGALTAIKVKK